MTFDEWMDRETDGKHCATDDSERMRLLRSCWDAAAWGTRQSVIAALGAMLSCPCCGETEVCVDECTFAMDCPYEAEAMSVLRDAVRA